MSQPYVGEIRIFGGNFAPAGWAFCDGQEIPISENDTLFNLIGTTYGGDGMETFALPNLQGRVPLHMGQGPGLTNRTLAETGGTESETLSTQQIPLHNHTPLASGTGGSDSPTGNVWGSSVTGKPYVAAPANASLNPSSIAPAGGSQPHDNMMPYLAVSYIISLYGIYPQPI
jgi:microcystin-dependent protein